MKTLKDVIKDIKNKSEEDRISITALQKEIDLIDRIIKMRKESGISQKELAQKIGVTQSAIVRFESQATSPKLDMVMKIAEALNTIIGLMEHTEAISPQFIDDYDRGKTTNEVESCYSRMEPTFRTIQILDERTLRFIEFLNTKYPATENVKLSVLNGYDSLTSNETDGSGFAVYIPLTKIIMLPTEIPKSIMALDDEVLTRNFIIHNLAHEYGHFLQDIGVLEGFNDEAIIEKVADEFADKAVAEFEAEENI